MKGISACPAQDHSRGRTANGSSRAQFKGESRLCPGDPIYFRGDRQCLHNSKPGKSAGHDQVQPEHLKYGGATLSLWIKQVANAIIELESVPQSLKLGIVTPSVQGRWQRSFRHQQLPWHHGITSPSQSVGVSDPWMAEWCAG